MEIFTIKEDIKVFCLKAKSFPDGIKEMFERLHRVAPIAEKRTYYGISYPDHILKEGGSNTVLLPMNCMMVN